MKIDLARELNEATDNILVVAIAGSPDEIYSQLQRICMDLRRGKPAQGVSLGMDYVTQIITPKWDGKMY